MIPAVTEVFDIVDLKVVLTKKNVWTELGKGKNKVADDYYALVVVGLNII